MVAHRRGRRTTAGHDPYAEAVPARSSPFPRRRPTRWIVGALVALSCSLLAVPDAGADAARPTNFESVIDSVRPDLDTIEVQIVGGDSFVQVTAEPGTSVLIPGYDGEPYLRIGLDGSVDRNRRSPATYINEARFGATGPLPEVADSRASPDWERVDDGGTVAWHDHRVHWMLNNAPDTSDGVVQPWSIPMQVDDVEVEISGRLLLREDQPPWPALVIVAVAALVGWTARREPARLALLGGASVVALGSSVTWFLGNPPGADPTVLPMVLPALALAACLVARLTRPLVRHLGLPLAAVALLVGWFVQRVGVVWMPTLPTPLPDVVERLITSAVAGVALGVAIAILQRPYPPPDQHLVERSDAATPTDQDPSTRRSSGFQP